MTTKQHVIELIRGIDDEVFEGFNMAIFEDFIDQCECTKKLKDYYADPEAKEYFTLEEVMEESGLYDIQSCNRKESA
ncbi:MAG: hypothetical protein LBM98_05005 [Oscillospiraceae bacterium]|nr:hypothetical protein [Oscillospiraceae bacterium]